MKTEIDYRPLVRLLRMVPHPEYADCWWRVPGKTSRGFVPLRRISEHLKSGDRPFKLLAKLNFVYRLEFELASSAGHYYLYVAPENPQSGFNEFDYQAHTQQDAIVDGIAKFMEFYNL